MKKFLSMVLAVILMTAGSVSLAAGKEDGFYTYYVKQDGTVEISKVNAKCTDGVIPGELGGKPVTSIGNYAFEGCGKLKSIVIPDTVTEIGDYAFRDCKSVTSITIPDSVSSIGEAFINGAKLKTIDISREHPHLVFNNGALLSKKDMTLIKFLGVKGNDYEVIWGIRKIASYAFEGAKVQNVILPNTVTEIGSYAFADCTALKSISIPGSMTAIGVDAFKGCKGLKSITIPDHVTSIGKDAFSGCDNLKEILISENNAALEARGNGIISKKDNKLLLVYGVRNGTYTIPEGVEELEAFMFLDSNLAGFILPEGLKSIPMGTFINCRRMKEIVIPNSVRTIEGRAFDGCSNLTKVVIPAGVMDINVNSFDNCNRATFVVTKGSYGERYCKALKLKYVLAE